ncbi:MBL fold metallo-hydrolase [Aeromicrobium choanae]|uniref:L-ascorbate metabolism protein UlaG, beta-lactamase superfamily n=1 Tax=Aeromicrobium choanae TaxID=1736691 RepID=A0A1T4Z2G1_9ACTN|nr:MBL fold metallo-hydrolase [Aeromicrobium choanae]SKB08053.1 L-ascorbate metabolism protein UlaG, beta-lactamase superfamily [Aeromicrobium choanae]
MRMKLGRPDLSVHDALFDLPAAAPDAPSVTFAGVSTLSFEDGGSALLIDGFFSRPSLARVGLGRISPAPERIGDGLRRLGLLGVGASRLEVVLPVHSHFDHAMDSAEVARRTGALLAGGTSTLNIGRGAGLPDDRCRPLEPGVPTAFGPWTVTAVPSEHCPPDRYPGTIDEPLRTPARASAYRCGEAWSLLVEHPATGATLVQGSAGFRPEALASLRADAVYLGIGQLGLLGAEYIEQYWTHTVTAVGARTVVLTHWDDFFRPLTRPLRALPYAGDDLDVTMRELRYLAGRDGVSLHLPTLWRREDPWTD